MKNQRLLEKETMTSKEIANVLGVRKNLVQETAKRLYPNRIKHGISTFWNEDEVSAISIEIKKNIGKGNSFLTVGSNQQLPITRKEVMKNAANALKDLLTAIADMDSNQSALQAENEMLKHQVEYNEVIGCSRWSDVKKLLGLKSKWEDVCNQLHLEENVDYFKKCMGYDKFPTIMITDNTVYRIKQDVL